MLLKFILVIVFGPLLECDGVVRGRQRRYLVFGPSTQYGAFVAISIPLPEPDNLVSVAWFLEANYFSVDNATWFNPLLGDIEISRSRVKRVAKQQEIITRTLFYKLIESMLHKHSYAGQPCLLRSICETSMSHFSHNGLLGDLLHLILTPSSSQDEDLQDCYYEAEYQGLDHHCGQYYEHCRISPLDNITMFVDHLL